MWGMRRAGVSRAKTWSIVLALLVVTGSIGTSARWPWDGPAASVWAAPLQQAAPGPFVQQAFDLLMDKFVTLPSSQTLLTGGWEGGARFVQAHASPGSDGAAPSFTGDRTADWQAFLASYPALVAAVGGAAEQVELDRAVVSGMASSLDASHTSYQRTVGGPQTQQRYGGIGIQTVRSRIIREVFPGTPAEAAGLRPGDQLIAVDSESVDGLTSQELSERIRGSIGSNIVISVRRSGQDLDFSMTREEISLDWVTSRTLDSGIGYLRLRVFAAPDGMPLFQNVVRDLAYGGIRGLIIDVRDNGGGPTLVQVASRFIRDADLFIATGRDNQQHIAHTMGAYWGRDIPIIVLVNEASRSAAELLAATLRENKVAEVLGTHTAGQAENSRGYDLADGSVLRVTTERIATVQGTVLEKHPLEPDIAVELDPAMLAQGKDSQLEAALAHLRAKLGQ